MFNSTERSLCFFLVPIIANKEMLARTIDIEALQAACLWDIIARLKKEKFISDKVAVVQEITFDRVRESAPLILLRSGEIDSGFDWIRKTCLTLQAKNVEIAVFMNLGAPDLPIDSISYSIKMAMAGKCCIQRMSNDKLSIISLPVSIGAALESLDVARNIDHISSALERRSISVDLQLPDWWNICSRSGLKCLSNRLKTAPLLAPRTYAILRNTL